MGNVQQIKKLNFEDMQMAQKAPEIYILINTLPNDRQECLISNTISSSHEEEIVNRFIKTNLDVQIILYGQHANDESVYRKYQQLTTLGFRRVFIYAGGLFEWLMLQNLYDEHLFPTTRKEVDLLKYKPKSLFTNTLLHARS